MISAASSPLSSATGMAFGQLQRQQAARMAELYEARAASLREQAKGAQQQADRATQQADNLYIQADQAQGEADTAKTAVASANTMGSQAQTQSARLVKALKAAVPADASATASGNVSGNAPGSGAAQADTAGTGSIVYSAPGRLNLQGQRTGQRVNVSV